eukprot:snap_masked-scaffold_52-processed-gene-0.25-mRNA-1 protein AED:1.00 eAED:1.00 QI:0/-1/0/0/-1/1/1/0/324
MNETKPSLIIETEENNLIIHKLDPYCDVCQYFYDDEVKNWKNISRVEFLHFRTKLQKQDQNALEALLKPCIPKKMHFNVYNEYSMTSLLNILSPWLHLVEQFSFSVENSLNYYSQNTILDGTNREIIFKSIRKKTNLKEFNSLSKIDDPGFYEKQFLFFHGAKLQKAEFQRTISVLCLSRSIHPSKIYSNLRSLNLNTEQNEYILTASLLNLCSGTTAPFLQSFILNNDINEVGLLYSCSKLVSCFKLKFTFTFTISVLFETSRKYVCTILYFQNENVLKGSIVNLSRLRKFSTSQSFSILVKNCDYKFKRYFKHTFGFQLQKH